MKTARQTRETQGNPGKVWRLVQKYTSPEELAKILAIIPIEVTGKAMTSKNPNPIFGEFVLGEDLEAFRQAKPYKRRAIACQAIAKLFEHAGIPVPEALQKPATFRGTRAPRSDSRLAKYSALLEKTLEFLNDPRYESIYDYLSHVEATLDQEVRRLTKLREYLRNRQSAKQD